MSLLKEALKAEILLKLKTKLVKNKKSSFGDFLDKLDLDEKEILLGFKLEELFDFSSLEKETKVEEEKIESKSLIGDETAYKGKILQFLKESGLGESGRGFLTSEIVEKCGGDNATARTALATLQTEKLIGSTGKTRSLRWIVKELYKQANDKFLKDA